jgi:hypothetical protein
MYSTIFFAILTVNEQKIQANKDTVRKISNKALRRVKMRQAERDARGEMEVNTEKKVKKLTTSSKMETKE